MRIVAVCPLYPPASLVGSWLSTHQLLAHLTRRGHDVEVIVQLGEPRKPYLHDGVVVSTGAGLIEPAVDTADVVISHLGDSGRAARAAATAGVPNIRLAHGGPVTAQRVEGAALIVWNAHSYATVVDVPTMVVHPPVVASRYCTTPGDHITLVNLSAAKGVKTFWRCAEEMPDRRFLGVLGGTGRQIHPRAPNVEVMATTPDMRAVYHRTSVLLVPSAEETWGRVAVEAMCSGIPVIAHPTPGLVESVGAGGTFVDRDDIAGWVAELRHLEDPDAWAEASCRALARADQLDPAADLDRFADAVEQLVGVPA